MAAKRRSPWLLVSASLAAMAVLGWLITLLPSGVGRAGVGAAPQPAATLNQPSAQEQVATQTPNPAQAQPKTAEQDPTQADLPLLASAPPVREEKVYRPPISAEADPNGHARQRTTAEAAMRFDQAVSMLHARQYEYAIAALKRVIELAPRSAQAYVNLGFAYLGLERTAEAQSAFQTAMHLRPEQANAYYGLAITHESQGELEAAMEAMLVFLDFAEGTPEENVYIRRGRSALWEWEAKLGDGPWGPTRGIPPGWTEEMVKRDGTGVGVYGMKRGEDVEQAAERRRREAEAAKSAPQAGEETPAG